MAFSEGLKEKYKKESLETIRKIWKDVLDYEKSCMDSVPTQKLLHYFGAEIICKLYGCIVVDEEIAKALIKKVFQK